MLKTSITKLLKTKTPKVGNTLFIGIDGQGGAGKSTLADSLAKELSAEIIHTDDFASWNNPLDWWKLLAPTIFIPIRNGRTTLQYERSQWWENPDQTPKLVTKRVTPIMILEGVSALREEFRDAISLGIFIDTPLETCLQRGITRDIADGSKKSREELETMWRKWATEEQEYFKNHEPEIYADVIIDGTKLAV